MSRFFKRKRNEIKKTTDENIVRTTFSRQCYVSIVYVRSINDFSSKFQIGNYSFQISRVMFCMIYLVKIAFHTKYIYFLPHFSHISPSYYIKESTSPFRSIAFGHIQPRPCAFVTDKFRPTYTSSHCIRSQLSGARRRF